jgi:hypothetical protein
MLAPAKIQPPFAAQGRLLVPAPRAPPPPRRK